MEKKVLSICAEELRAQLSLRMLKAAGLDVVRAARPEEVEAILKQTPDIGVVMFDGRLSVNEAAQWVVRWKAMSGGDRPHYIVVSDRMPTPTESGAIFEQGVSDVWLRPLPDYLLAPKLKIWLRLNREGQGLPSAPPSIGLDEPLDEVDRGTLDGLIDSETRLPARDLFLEMAEGLFAGSKRFGVYVGCLAITISNLKDVERRLGPQGQHEAVVFLSKELTRIKRREDFLGRWNESIFVLTSYFTTGEGVEAFGRRMIDGLKTSRFPRADLTGPLRFTVAGAWGPSRDYALASEALEAVVNQVHTIAEG